MYGSPPKAFAALRVTSDKVFITNGDDFHSPTEEGGMGGARQRRVSVFFESLRARETAWATNLPFDDGRDGSSLPPISLSLGITASSNEPLTLYCPT